MSSGVNFMGGPGVYRKRRGTQGSRPPDGKLRPKRNRHVLPSPPSTHRPLGRAGGGGTAAGGSVPGVVGVQEGGSLAGKDSSEASSTSASWWTWGSGAGGGGERGGGRGTTEHLLDFLVHPTLPECKPFARNPVRRTLEQPAPDGVAGQRLGVVH